MRVRFATKRLLCCRVQTLSGKTRFTLVELQELVESWQSLSQAQRDHFCEMIGGAARYADTASGYRLLADGRVRQPFAAARRPANHIAVNLGLWT